MDPQLVFDDVTGETLGYVMRASATSSKPIYISPGNRMTADSALELVKRTLHGRRLPDQSIGRTASLAARCHS